MTGATRLQARDAKARQATPPSRRRASTRAPLLLDEGRLAAVGTRRKRIRRVVQVNQLPAVRALVRALAWLLARGRHYHTSPRAQRFALPRRLLCAPGLTSKTRRTARPLMRLPLTRRNRDDDYSSRKKSSSSRFTTYVAASVTPTPWSIINSASCSPSISTIRLSMRRT